MTEILHIILPVLVGAVIGYCTNYIAIRMLFHPYKAVYIGKRRLPFTPGIIPKNQSRLANAMGDAVSGQLLTKDVITESFRRTGSGKKIISDLVTSVCESDHSVSEWLPDGDTKEEIENILTANLSRSIFEKVEQIDMKTVICNIGEDAMGPLLENRPMIAMFLSDNLKNAIYDRLGDTAQEYVKRNGEDFIRKYVSEYIRDLGEKPFGEIIRSGGDEEDVKELLTDVIGHVAVRYADTLLDQVDIKEITRQRIEEMKVNEVEALVMAVMKHELRAVINLGALIGAVIGIVNIFL